MISNRRRIHLETESPHMTACGQITSGAMRTRPMSGWHLVIPEWRCPKCSASLASWTAARMKRYSLRLVA